MIPPDVASSLRAVIPDPRSETNSQAQPVTRGQQVADALSNLVPGQRIFAEIQALMPNGAYRAVVGQREITLALPFSAKAGDTLELEVAESDGKLTLAFVANRTSGNNAATPPESVNTSLSIAGKVIGNLLTPLEGEGKQAAPAALNRSQPLVEAMPKSAADLAPVLKQALSQSGMFYEAHQARWVSGQLPTAALLQEPQGKLLPAPLNPPEFINRSANFPPGNPLNSPAETIHLDPLSESSIPATQTPATPLPDADGLTQLPPREPTDKSPALHTNPAVNGNFGEKTENLPPHQSATTAVPTPQTSVSTSASAVPNENPVPRELIPLVQQQLNGLAAQNFVWQGQVWPGQPMWWEISGDPESKPSQENNQASQWQTRLKLDLPTLGGIDVTLRLGIGGALAVSVSAENPASETTLRNSAQPLREQLAAAGLTLTQLRVDHGQAGE